jgi:branched-chain amino acid transport system ATP-binding protein
VTTRRATLRVGGLVKSFGALRAVDGVDLAVEEGSLTALIGPNGAGKSTLLRCLSGGLEPDAGRVELAGEDVSRWPAHRRARAGLGMVFQATRPLERADVLTNVAIGCHAWSRCGFVEGILRPPWQRREEREVRVEASRALEAVGLGGRARDDAHALPLGQLRLLSIARVLAQRPRMLLLDEPVAGLRAAEKAHVIAVLRELRERGMTQILVEHDMQFVGSVADRVVVLDRGGLIADGAPVEIARDERVIQAYLGTATL